MTDPLAAQDDGKLAAPAIVNWSTREPDVDALVDVPLELLEARLAR